MAFYTVTVNECGEEMERRKTHRGLVTRRTCFESDQESVTSRSIGSLNNGYPRYRNPATWTEKSYNSIESLSEIVPSIVPSLDLNSSGETMPSSDSGPGITFEIQKQSKSIKTSHSDAFSCWLSAKKKMKSYEIAKQKEIKEEHKRRLEEKKRQAEESYNEWLVNKMKTKDKPVQREMQVYHEVSQQHNDDAESNRRAWEQSKRETEQRKKEKLLKLKECQKQQEEMRKKEAKKAWEDWLEKAPQKPKPVPLNKGLFTLKGTISDIFINPNPWQNTCEDGDFK